MKKLMIVAAVAAMAGAAVAVDGYDFTASVKTTTGKLAKAKNWSRSYSIKLGEDADKGFWWEVFTPFTTADDAKNWLKKDATKEQKLELAEAVYADLNDGKELPDAAGLKIEWGEKTSTGKPGKKDWCSTFTCKKDFGQDALCYRVATSRKFKGIVQMDDCCSGWEFVAVDADFDLDNLDADTGYSDIANTLIYRFNGATLDKANKVEVAGTMGGASFDASTIGTWAFAGQGAYDVKNDRISNISGNIVGVLDNPDCEKCCDYGETANVWDCGAVEGDDPNDTPSGTAAFGTFSLKYNKRY